MLVSSKSAVPSGSSALDTPAPRLSCPKYPARRVHGPRETSARASIRSLSTFKGPGAREARVPNSASNAVWASASTVASKPVRRAPLDAQRHIESSVLSAVQEPAIVGIEGARSRRTSVPLMSFEVFVTMLITPAKASAP